MVEKMQAGSILCMFASLCSKKAAQMPKQKMIAFDVTESEEKWISLIVIA
ncbi:MAG: hypothetical protein MSC43_07825 [Clostridiales bacterium]|nr:hypothetical protein [Clostridiales bacterium]MDD7431857.1 hypothetical protein [Clostridiales bacterium]MDY3062063.1 hypothetical protein [Eubacteriales bacterium]